MATVTKKLTITLILTEEEAHYIKELTQNFMGGNPDLEEEATYDIRNSIFEALAEVV